MKTALILASLTLAGCSTQLGMVQAQPDKTMEQRDIAMMFCVKQAEVAGDSPSRMLKSAALGATLVGAPFAESFRRKEMREVFAQCMNERGFTVTPPQ